MTQKVYKKSVILAAIKAKITEITEAHNKAVDTAKVKFDEKVGVLSAQFVESGLTRDPPAASVSVEVPSQGYVDTLKQRATQIEALADVEKEKDTVLLDEAEASTILAPGAYPKTRKTFTAFIQ